MCIWEHFLVNYCLQQTRVSIRIFIEKSRNQGIKENVPIVASCLIGMNTFWRVPWNSPPGVTSKDIKVPPSKDTASSLLDRQNEKNRAIRSPLLCCHSILIWKIKSPLCSINKSKISEYSSWFGLHSTGFVPSWKIRKFMKIGKIKMAFSRSLIKVTVLAKFWKHHWNIVYYNTIFVIR